MTKTAADISWIKIGLTSLFGGVLLLCMCHLCACSLPTEHTSTLDQRQRENVAQEATSKFVQAVQPSPVSVIVEGKDGSKTTITQPAPTSTNASATTKEKSASEASGNWFDALTIPLFVKIIGIAIGIGLLAAVIGCILWYLRKSSVAVNTAWSWMDEAITNRLNTVKALKGASTDPIRIQALTETEAHLESLRAEANK